MKKYVIALLFVTVGLVGACDKKDGEATGEAATGDKAGAAAAADGAKLEAAYQSTFGDMNRKDTFDDKLKDLKGQIGEPAQTEGKDMFWWGWDEKNKMCREIKIIDGAGGMLKMADKSKCGK